jgi:hypothetical protein
MFLMKKLLFTIFSLLLAGMLTGQPVIDLGVKAGATVSTLHFRENIPYFAKNALRYHLGAFSRIGWGRFFIQPEVYFNSRGGYLKSSGSTVTTAVANFDFSGVDVPLLAGLKFLKDEIIQFRLMAGPMLGFMTSRQVEPRPTYTQLFSKKYFQDHLFGWQLGLGMDFRRYSLDVRMERSRNSVYQSDDFTTKNNLVLVSLGVKIF